MKAIKRTKPPTRGIGKHIQGFYMKVHNHLLFLLLSISGLLLYACGETPTTPPSQEVCLCEKGCSATRCKGGQKIHSHTQEQTEPEPTKALPEISAQEPQDEQVPQTDGVSESHTEEKQIQDASSLETSKEATIFPEQEKEPQEKRETESFPEQSPESEPSTERIQETRQTQDRNPPPDTKPPVPRCRPGKPLSKTVPVLPGTQGFGIDTPAGRGGTVYKVTTLQTNDSKGQTLKGSLKDCLRQKGPRVCVFEVGGTIQLSENLRIEHPYITIAGQTAPHPGITLYGGGLKVHTHDVLIQHIRIRPGSQNPKRGHTERDPLTIASPSSYPRHTIPTAKNKRLFPTGIVIDHVTLNWSTDELMAAWYSFGKLTFRHVLVGLALHESIHPQKYHGLGPLFGFDKQSQVSVYGSLFAHATSRLLRTGASRFFMANNVIYNRLVKFMEFYNRDKVTSQSTLINNIFKDGPSVKNASRKPFEIRKEAIPGSKLYVSGNRWINGNTKKDNTPLDQWTMVDFEANQPSITRSSKPVVMLPGYKVLKTANTIQWVLTHAGARPAFRDQVEKDLVSSVNSNTGQIINCEKEVNSPAKDKQRCTLKTRGWPNAGKWLSSTSTKKTLRIPADHKVMTTCGYTRLELLLHQCAGYVETGKGSCPLQK